MWPKRLNNAMRGMYSVIGRSLIVRIALIVASACLSASVSAQSIQPPAGYRLPTESDFKFDWSDNRATMPTPFRAQGDFDGNGIPDEVWLLPKRSGNGFGVFVFLHSRTGAAKVMKLTSARNAPPQRYTVGVAKPDYYETACGKGYGDFACAHGEPERLELKLPGIWFSLTESASSIFWWDAQTATFRRALIND
jgi:hypothetical protein